MIMVISALGFLFVLPPSLSHLVNIQLIRVSSKNIPFDTDCV